MKCKNMYPVSVMAIFRCFIVLIVLNSLLYSEEKGKSASPFREFVPYVAEQANDAAVLEVDVSELGKEQPARWMSVDPMADKYPGWSPYNYCMNNPAILIDPTGEEVYVTIYEVDENGRTHLRRLRYQDNKLHYENGDEYTGNDKFADAVLTNLNKISEGANGSLLINYLVNSTREVDIQRVQKGGNAYADYVVGFNIDKQTDTFTENGYTAAPFYVSLGHELAHAADDMMGLLDQGTWATEEGQKIHNSEKWAGYYENLIRKEHGEPLRTHYGVIKDIYNRMQPMKSTRYLDGKGVPLFSKGATKRITKMRTGL